MTAQPIKKTIQLILFFGLSMGLCLPLPAQTDPPKEPLWELGIAGGGARLPHYRGSDEYTWWVAPLPFVVYRGDILRATRDGIRGVFFDSEYIETSISIYGNPPVSSDNQARRGMPKLDAIFEIGPELKWFFGGRSRLNRFYLAPSIRIASSIDIEQGLDIAYQGVNVGLDLVYSNRQYYRDYGFQYHLSASINCADSNLNGYFYNVDRQYTTDDRDFYQSDGGYSGFTLFGSCRKEIFRDVDIGLFTRWDNLNEAVFLSSPLVVEQNNYSIGFFLVWKFYKSQRMVQSTD